MKWLKVTGVIMGALLITALGIDATDTLNGSSSTLLGQIIATKDTQACPDGMLEVPMAKTFTCVDIYEASPSRKCPHVSVQNDIQTKENIDVQECTAQSVEKAQTWAYITRDQAQTACVRAGKRLPSYDEWHLIAVGTPHNDSACNLNRLSASLTGSLSDCKSAVGAYDTVGNVWEWIANDVIDGNLEGQALPSSGYVAQTTTDGIATVTSDTPNVEFFSSDYFWASPLGAFGMLRGGFFGSKSDGGIYAVHAETTPTAAGTAIGFRCVQ